MLTLQEVKDYLRIDDGEDDLLRTLLAVAKKMVYDAGRIDEGKIAKEEESVRIAMMYAVAYLYENRETANYDKLILSLRAILYAAREDEV